MDIQLENGERLEPVGKSVSVVVSPYHSFGTDALLLADFASVKKNDKACDLGTGCGIIPLIWYKNGLCSRIDAIEIQSTAVSQLKKTVELNAMTDKLRIHQADLRNAVPTGELCLYDVVTMNPPYKPCGTGIESQSSAEKIARHETECTLDDVFACGKRLLKYGGRMCICHRPERLCDIFVKMRENGMEPKRMRLVSQMPGKPPWLVLIEGRVGGKPFLTVENELYIQNPDGSDSDDITRIYGDYRENAKFNKR